MPPRGYTPVGVPEETASSRGASISATAANKTVGMMQSQMGFDPVVGWLACVAGPSRGKSYTVRGGVNSIGRSERMDIVITGDLKISAENHARISYSEKNNRFSLLPGEGRNIVYLNDEEVYTPMRPAVYLENGEDGWGCLMICSAAPHPRPRSLPLKPRKIPQSFGRRISRGSG